MPWWEPLAAYWSRKRLERLQYQAAVRLLESLPDPCRVVEDPDADRWRLLHADNSKNRSTDEQEHWRETVRRLVDANPFARNALSLYRNYVVGTGMRHEVMPAATISSDDPRIEQAAHRRADAVPLLKEHTQGADAPRSATDAARSESVLHHASQLWTHFLLTNQ